MFLVRPKWLLSLQVRPVRPDIGSTSLPVEASRGEQGHFGESQKRKEDVAQGDNEEGTQRRVVVYSQRKLFTCHLMNEKMKSGEIFRFELNL